MRSLRSRTFSPSHAPCARMASQATRLHEDPYSSRHQRGVAGLASGGCCHFSCRDAGKLCFHQAALLAYSQLRSHMQALSWAWGGPNHGLSHSETPDDAALRATATVMQQFAGPFADRSLYPIGRTNGEMRSAVHLRHCCCCTSALLLHQMLCIQ